MVRCGNQSNRILAMTTILERPMKFKVLDYDKIRAHGRCITKGNK